MKASLQADARNVREAATLVARKHDKLEQSLVAAREREKAALDQVSYRLSCCSPSP